MKLETRLFQIWLSLRCRTVNHALQACLEAFGTPYDLYAADDAELESVVKDEKLLKALKDKDLTQADRILKDCKEKGISILFWQDEAYPLSLKSIADPPLLLYYMGAWQDINRHLCIGVVGSRTAGEYAKAMAYQLSYELAAVGGIVVSGMALGVDAVAAAGALASGGKTIAVLACGVDIAYPSGHATLKRYVEKKGVVISEYPPGTRAQKYYFPARNRIISGLSQGVLVVQAAKGSGALITADYAIRQGRDVFALPGQVGDKDFEGANQLLRDGAVFVQDVTDILKRYELLFADVLQMSKLKIAKATSAVDEAFCRSLEVQCKRVRENVPTTEERHTIPVASVPKVSPVAKTSATPSVMEERTPPPPPPKHEGDRSESILATLTDRQREMFEKMPLDKAVDISYMVREGFTVPEVLASMTILASKGLVSLLPGSLYIRA